MSKTSMLSKPTRFMEGTGAGPLELGASCFACELGLEGAAADPLEVRIAIELRDERGPAKARGIRQAVITEKAKQRAKERKNARARERAKARREAKKNQTMEKST